MESSLQRWEWHKWSYVSSTMGRFVLGNCLEVLSGKQDVRTDCTHLLSLPNRPPLHSQCLSLAYEVQLAA
jgi:hypothetical protein